MKKCAFCPQDAVESGGEHIWDDWLNKELPTTTYRAKKQLSLNSPVIEHDANELNEKVPVVCAECNNRWMGALSDKVRLAFRGAILHGETFSLGPKDAALLAAFAFMKAVVTNHGSVDDYPFFTTADREKLRTSLIVPPFIKVWFAAFQGVSRMSTKSNFAIFSVTDQGPLWGMEFASHTYVVGHLALQLLAPRWKNVRDRGRPLLTLTPDSYWDPAASLFWPHRGGGAFISWPPKKYLGDNTIKAFIYRFNRPINVPIARRRSY